MVNSVFGLVTNIKNCHDCMRQRFNLLFKLIIGSFLLTSGLYPGLAAETESPALRGQVERYSIYDVPIEEAQTRQLFSYFRFRPDGYRVTQEGFTQINYRLPRTNRWRSFVNLSVDLNEHGRIVRARLIMKRRFVDEGVRGAFARDYAKSFVQAAVPDEELASVRPLYNEIFFRQEITKIKLPKDNRKSLPDTVFKLGSGKLKSGDIIILGPGGDLPRLPKKPSDLYRCFAGEIPSGQMRLEHSILTFSNERIESEPGLVISIAPLKEEERSKPGRDIDFSSLPMRAPFSP